VNSLILTEKQQEVLWLRYGRRASINQIAAWLKISRRAVLSRLRNARLRTSAVGAAFPERLAMPAADGKPRMYAASQISAEGENGVIQLDEL
jgi:predicted DNA-binding protein YlxM (UPF0122 family)